MEVMNTENNLTNLNKDLLNPVGSIFWGHPLANEFANRLRANEVFNLGDLVVKTKADLINELDLLKETADFVERRVFSLTGRPLSLFSLKNPSDQINFDDFHSGHLKNIMHLYEVRGFDRQCFSNYTNEWAESERTISVYFRLMNVAHERIKVEPQIKEYK